jgi:hypothetical protein
MTLELSSETNLLLKMPVNSSFPAIKPLPGTKKNFPDVNARVNSQPMISRKPNKNSSGAEVGMNRMFPQLLKARTHHDSSAVSACLKTDTGNPKKLEFKSKIPVRKPEMIGNRIESPTKLKWNSTTQINRSAEIKPLPGIKKTLGDFVRKPFRATPAPASTHNPRLVVMTKDRQEVKKGLRQQPVEKPGNKIIPDSRKPNPFRAIPAPVSTYKPFELVLPSKARQPVDKGKLKEGQQQLIIKPFVQNVATTPTLSFPEEKSDETNRIPKEPYIGLSDPDESMDGQAENSHI